ncbi:MAG TPA: hypothetical protein VIJ95_10840 [Hanamia sp.]
MKLQPGRHVYGLAAIILGIIGLVWHQFNTWQQVQALGNIPHMEVFVSMVAILEIVGGIAVQWKKTARVGAILLFIIYLFFALLWLPFIIETPLVYNGWGNFFEEFSLVCGALIVYSTVGAVNSVTNTRIARMGYIFFGICIISFTLEQALNISATAGFIPKWMPLGQMFWSVATTIAFALAAISLFTGWLVLLTSRLLTLMIICFGVFVWLPILFNDPHQMFNWAGNAVNLAICGAAWIVSDYLAQLKTIQQTRSLD